jgi:hypothetical protein
MKTYTFDNFDYIDGDVTFPENIIFFSTCSIISDTPIYLISPNESELKEKTQKIITTKSIKIIDICKLKNIIQLIIASRKLNDEIMMRCIKSLTLSFGDVKSIMILRELFDGVYDGFITFGQIIIFNPKLSGIELFVNDEFIHIYNLNDALHNIQHKLYVLKTSESYEKLMINQYDIHSNYKKEAVYFKKNVRLYRPHNFGELISLPNPELI